MPVHMYTDICVCRYTCNMWVWRPEADGEVSLLLLTLLVEMRSLADPEFLLASLLTWLALGSLYLGFPNTGLKRQPVFRLVLISTLLPQPLSVGVRVCQTAYDWLPGKVGAAPSFFLTSLCPESLQRLLPNQLPSSSPYSNLSSAIFFVFHPHSTDFCHISESI